MTELAHNLGLTATAEGIETLEQLAVVRELGCDVGQGFLISMALDPDALIGWKKEFRQAWPKLMAEQPLALWGDVEANTLGER